MTAFVYSLSKGVALDLCQDDPAIVLTRLRSYSTTCMVIIMEPWPLPQNTEQ
jgi:hypothetical protein